jgi:hypothetical protein
VSLTFVTCLRKGFCNIAIILSNQSEQTRVLDAASYSSMIMRCLTSDLYAVITILMTNRSMSTEIFLLSRVHTLKQVKRSLLGLIQSLQNAVCDHGNVQIKKMG